jgi:hypothetical protein
MTDDPDSYGNAFSGFVVMIGRVRVRIMRGEEESTAPHARLSYVHLRCLL